MHDTGSYRESGSSMGESHIIAVAQARGLWQRSVATRNMVQEDFARTPKFVPCPLPCIVPSRSPEELYHSVKNSLYWSNSSLGSLDPRLDLQWQFSPGTTQRDNRSDAGRLGETPNTRVSLYQPAGLQSLAADRIASMEHSTELTGNEGNISPDLELDWQFVVDPQCKVKGAASKDACGHTVCNNEEEFRCENTRCTRSKALGTDSNQQVATGETGTCDIITRDDNEVAPYKCQYGDFHDKKHSVLAPKLDAVFFQEIAKDDHAFSLRSSVENNNLSQRPDDQASAGVLAGEFEDNLETSDLTCTQAPKPRVTSREYSASFDISPSLAKPGDKNLIKPSLRGHELSCLENLGISPTSPFLSNVDPTPSPSERCQRNSHPLDAPSSAAPPATGLGIQRLSADARTGGEADITSISDTTSISGRGSGLLGQALCHSQTRAREAEKKMKQLYKENGQLVDLFFKEASISLTYRQLVISLQYENMWLKMSARHERVACLQRGILWPFSNLERIKRWKNFGQGCYMQHQMEHQICAMCHEKDIVYLMDSNDVMICCSLAAALGFSLAGAGLILGWGMGRILRAH